MEFDFTKIYWPPKPFEFKCSNCKRTQEFTEAKIEEVKVKTPDTSNDYHIVCEFCKKWRMEPPVFIQSSWIFE